MTRAPTSAEIEILRNLFEAGDKGLDLYDLHKRFKLSPSQLAHTCRLMHDAGLLEIIGQPPAAERMVRVSELGKSWILSNRRALFLRPRARDWRLPSETQTAVKLAPFAPISPTRDS